MTGDDSGDLTGPKWFGDDDLASSLECNCLLHRFDGKLVVFSGVFQDQVVPFHGTLELLDCGFECGNLAVLSGIGVVDDGLILPRLIHEVRSDINRNCSALAFVLKVDVGFRCETLISVLLVCHASLAFGTK
jgi:hypothetical protein